MKKKTIFRISGGFLINLKHADIGNLYLKKLIRSKHLNIIRHKANIDIIVKSIFIIITFKREINLTIIHK